MVTLSASAAISLLSDLLPSLSDPRRLSFRDNLMNSTHHPHRLHVWHLPPPPLPSRSSVLLLSSTAVLGSFDLKTMDLLKIQLASHVWLLRVESILLKLTRDCSLLLQKCMVLQLPMSITRPNNPSVLLFKDATLSFQS